jgi:hypothetical protein
MRRLLGWCLAVLLLTPAWAPYPQADDDERGHMGPGTFAAVYADPRNAPGYVPPPFPVGGNAPERTESVPIIVNYNTPACGANIAAWPANTQAAVNYAASIWRSVLNGTQTIVVDACWRTDLAVGQLANASATASFRDFAGAPRAGTWYPAPLANQIGATDFNTTTVEIQARFNANFTWYAGLDGNVPLNQFDLVTVALHELGHGLGFGGGMNWDDGAAANGVECTGTVGIGCWGAGTWGGFPTVFDRFTQNVTGTLLSLANNSVDLGNGLTDDTLAFNGTFANLSNGGTPPRLHAPNVWVAGTSYVHLREASFATGTINALMTPFINAQEAIHHPGAIALALLGDMGWGMMNLFNTYVSGAWNGQEHGTFTHPFNTVAEGVGAVANGGTVWIQGPRNYPGVVTILRPMTLNTYDGPVTIGAP